MQTAFLITARLKSTRLEKKIILEVKGKPLIVHMINRIKFAKKINKIIICTSTNAQDDLLEKIAKQENIFCYRGSESDVLQRLLDASKEFKLDYFANITADIPMIDPFFVDFAVEEYNRVNADLVLPPKYTLCGCIIVKVASLNKVCQIKKEKDTELWVKFFKDQKKFKIHVLNVEKNRINRFLKTSLDYPEDYAFIERVFEELYKPNQIFTTKDIINLIATKPDIAEINASSAHLKRWYDHQATNQV